MLVSYWFLLTQENFLKTHLSLCFVGIFCLTTQFGLSQDLRDCEKDYSPLKESHLTTWEELLPGMTLYLSREYIQDLTFGGYDYAQSPLVFFDYIRPATRQEIRHGVVEGFQREAVGQDGNVYVARSLDGDQHFFQPNAAFEGDYFGVAGDSTLLLPLGLEPIDVNSFADIPMVLEEKTTQYLRFDVLGNSVVFYLGYPSLSYTLDTERVRRQVEEKRELAKALIGQSFLVQNESNLRFRSSPNGDNLIHHTVGNELMIRVRNIISERSQVLLITDSEEPNYLVLDEASDFILYDADCVDEKRVFHVRQLHAESEALGINRRLNEMILMPDEEDWRVDPWVNEVIARRFVLDERSRKTPKAYQYLLDTQRNRMRHSYLSAQVDQMGQYCLISQFSSPQALYHTRIIVYLGQDSLVSTRVSALDDRSERTYEQGWVVERLSLDQADDREIIKAIALSEEDLINVRFFSGGSYFHDIILTDIDRQCIRDTWMMGEILRQKQEMTLRQFGRDK